MDQKRYRQRTLNIWKRQSVAILAICVGQTWAQPAAAATGATAETALCKDFVGQDPSPPDIKRMIEVAPGGNVRRLAIVIGNNYPGRPKGDGTLDRSAYAVPALVNATQDAKSIAALLLTLQFKVACFLNVSAKFHDRIITNATLVGDTGTNALTFYYFAGHGFAVGKESFGVGDGAERDSVQGLKMSSLPQTSILSGLRSRGAPVVAIFDMCRGQLEIVDADGKRALDTKPLDRYQPISKVPGLLVHYSTSPNEYAADLPTQKNGLYARVFLDQTPNQPGVSAEPLLNDFVGKILADGLQIEGKVYKQVPHLEAYPDDWTKVQIFDTASAPVLDQVMSFVINLERMTEGGAWAIAHACRLAIQIRNDWMAAPDPAGSHTTVARLLTRLTNLLQRMKDKGYSCPEILTTYMASNPVVLPPLAHVAKTPVVLSAAGESAANFDLAKAGTWFSTNSVTLPINASKIGTLAAATQSSVQLESAFVPSSKAAYAPSSPEVYFTPIDRENAQLINTKDQVVVRFKPGTADLIDPNKLSVAIRDLNRIKWGSRRLVLLFPDNKPQSKNYLARLRLSALRVGVLIEQLVKGGFRYDQILVPDADLQTPISIATLHDNELLVKLVGSPPTVFEDLDVDTLKAGFATNTAKKNLERYQAATRKGGSG